MSLRGLSSLLIRRFSPRRIPAAQAETTGSASGRPARFLHTLNDLEGGVGTAAAVGAFSMAGLAALVGFLYLNKDDKAGDTTNDGASTVVVTSMRDALNDPAIKEMFTDKDGNTAWHVYHDYLVFRKHYLEMSRKHNRDRKMPITDKDATSEAPDSWKVPMKQVDNVMKVDEAALKKIYKERRQKQHEMYENHMKMVMDQEYTVDEAVMQKRFADWMKEFGRTYKDDKEKARRYEVFKANAIKADKLTAHNGPDGARYRPQMYGDWTEDELKRLGRHQGEMNLKSFVEDLRARYAEEGFDSYLRKLASQELDCTDAVKERTRFLIARKAEQERQAKKAVASEKAGIAGN